MKLAINYWPLTIIRQVGMFLTLPVNGQCLMGNG
jgi:hypothetical protein